MELEDLKPYFELYNNLRDAGRDTILHFDLTKKEKEYAGKELHFEGIVSEIDLEKNELIVTCHIGGMQDSLHNITSNHFFVFASSATLPELLKKSGAGVDDLVKIDGSISTLHRNSVVRVTLNSIRVLEKKYRGKKSQKKLGCFIATAVYGSPWSNEVMQFYKIRDGILSKTVAGRLFINLYYFLSPPLARWIENKPRVKKFVRHYLLEPILRYYR